MNRPCPGIEQGIEVCPTGERATLMEANQYFWDLFLEIRPFLFDSFGAVNHSAAEFIFKTRQVPEAARPRLLDKLLIVVNTVEELRAEKKKNNQ